MNKLISSTLFLLVASMLLLSSCNSKGKSFSVNGEIASADGQVLYLEHRGLGGLEIVDSVKLKENGKFSFKEEAPVNPEFYQLRLGEQIIVFAVDSIEKLQLSADASDLYNTYEIEPAILNQQIKKVMDMQRAAKKDISSLIAKHEKKEIEDIELMEQVDSVLTVYKTFASNLILGNPSSAAAYYAVFQKIDDYLIFDPYEKKDYPMFGAVATSWNRFYPDAPRTKHLYEFTMNALRVRKQQQQQGDLLNNITVTESQLPDISLMNVKGQKASLSSLKGSIVLLDFTAYKTDFSLQHNEAIKRVYEKYKSNGMTVYQISFDSDAHFWKNVSAELPWTTVYDPASVNSDLLRSYNVRELPTAYILNKEGDMVRRVEDFGKLDQYISELL
ncbi:MAG: AhpC/TSA family protein [Bacteroidales bacterium]|jgi:peroxiredoxin|nr:AhpC/TSA family protein [Bacteroidales bacterium]